MLSNLLTASLLIRAALYWVSPSEGDTIEEVGFVPVPAMPGQLSGNWNPLASILLSQYAPDRYGWALRPRWAMSLGPAFKNGKRRGPAYLELPHDTNPLLFSNQIAGVRESSWTLEDSLSEIDSGVGIKRGKIADRSPGCVAAKLSQRHLQRLGIPHRVLTNSLVVPLNEESIAPISLLLESVADIYGVHANPRLREDGQVEVRFESQRKPLKISGIGGKLPVSREKYERLAEIAKQTSEPSAADNLSLWVISPLLILAGAFGSAGWPSVLLGITSVAQSLDMKKRRRQVDRTLIKTIKFEPV